MISQGDIKQVNGGKSVQLSSSPRAAGVPLFPAICPLPPATSSPHHLTTSRPQDERRQLMELAGISPEDQAAILNLFHLGVTLLHGTASPKKRPSPKKTSPAEATYDVSRYEPPLKR